MCIDDRQSRQTTCLHPLGFILKPMLFYLLSGFCLAIVPSNQTLRLRYRSYQDAKGPVMRLDIVEEATRPGILEENQGLLSSLRNFFLTNGQCRIIGMSSGPCLGHHGFRESVITGREGMVFQKQPDQNFGTLQEAGFLTQGLNL